MVERVEIRLTIAHHLGSATVRTQTTAALRASREQLEAIMRAVDEGIVVQSIDGSIVYANDGAVPFNLDVRRNMGLNARYQFVLLYTVGWDRIAAAAADINHAIEDGAFRVGEQAGLPLHRFTLEEAAAAHAAVEGGAVGKVLVTVATP